MEKKDIKIENWEPNGEINPFLKGTLLLGQGKTFINKKDELYKIKTLAEKIFSPKNSKKIEVIEDSSLLTIRIYNKKGLVGWFSLVEIKRFYEVCQKENLITFRYSWELTSIDLDDPNFIDINFHLL
ncbi:hypothetical protein C1631_022810 [Chryseobacterium phosphatilyticum]|uniref:Uncharacterized protein n=1 Tax=Chryseobacterium phosphatilyticum TaxID=475075 RepID=A0A316WMN8_9FLAO|nr:hypothetical protein [Chryseobacterium phosphatilyticum]PWN62399.1 hypothetical protein C1631_022810 [Chryseobacterium phosphatilyticum]